METQNATWVVDEEDGTAGRLLRDSAVIIGGTTALAYAVAFAYEMGYCRYFGIPWFVISPTPAVIIYAVIGLMGVMFSWTQFQAFPRILLKDFSRPFVFRIEAALLFSLGSMALFGLSWSAAAAIAFAFLMFFGNYIAVIWRTGTFKDRVNSIDREPDPVNELNPLTQTLRKAGKGASLAFVVALFSVFGAQALGAGAARLQKDFFVMEARPDVVMVKAYGDLMVGIKFDDGTRAATGEIVLFKIGEEFKQVNVTSKRIGPLKGHSPPFLDVDFWSDTP